MENETLEVVIKKYVDNIRACKLQKYLDLLRLGQDNFAKNADFFFRNKEHSAWETSFGKWSIEYVDQVFPFEKVEIKTRVEKLETRALCTAKEFCAEKKLWLVYTSTIVMIDKNETMTIPPDVRTNSFRNNYKSACDFIW